MVPGTGVEPVQPEGRGILSITTERSLIVNIFPKSYIFIYISDSYTTELTSKHLNNSEFIPARLHKNFTQSTTRNRERNDSINF